MAPGPVGRSVLDLVRIAGQLEKLRVGLESITEKIETVSSAGKLVFHVFAALAEFERNVIRARLRTAGRPLGNALSQGQAADSRALERPAVHVKDVAGRFGVSVATLHKRVGVVTPEK